MTNTYNIAMLDSRVCELGEGPTYDRYTDTSWWFDIINRRLFAYSFKHGVATQHDLPFAASALARVDDQRQLLFTERGLYLRDVASGALTLHLEIEADNVVTRSNDARVHPSGAFWLGTMGWNLEKEAGSIYHYYKGKLTKLFGNITITNAICFSSDGTVGYFADTFVRKVWRVVLDPLSGLPVAEPTLFLDDYPAGNPDGAVVDAEGNFWVALWGGSQVAGFAPDGSYLRSISVPVSQPSCPVFVGDDARKMLVTSAWTGLDAAAREAEPAGAAFVVDLPFQGKFEPDVKIT